LEHPVKTTTLALFLAAGLGLSPLARAQEMVKPENRNAALRYATIAYSGDRDLFTKTGDVDMSKVGFDAASLPADFQAACAALKAEGSGTVGQLLEATRLSKCDFEIAWEKGVMVLLPHLGKLRADARLLRVDARRLEIAGDSEGAAERLAALIRMSKHAAGDDILISSLVGVAICNLAIEETDAALAAGKLTPAGAHAILAALDTLDHTDPFHMKGALRGEQRWSLQWVKANFHGADAGKQLVATGVLTMDEGGVSHEVSDAARAIGLMNEAQLDAAVDLASPYYDKAIAAWDAPDAPAQLEALAQRVTNGEFGPIGRIFTPAISKCRESATKADARIASIRAKLIAVK
jgi:hypothetical protein